MSRIAIGETSKEKPDFFICCMRKQAFQAVFHIYHERKSISMIEKKAYTTPNAKKLDFDFTTTITASGSSAPQMTYDNRDSSCVQTGIGFADGYGYCTAWNGDECNLDKDWDD